MNKPLRLLIDGDVVIYQHMLGLEQEIEWEEDIWSLHCDIGEAKLSMNRWLERMLDIFGAKTYTFALSCSTEEGFRYKLNPLYKANRAGKRKPLGMKAMKDWCIDQFGAVKLPELEADDILGICATDPERLHTEEMVIVSIDKDFRAVPCHFYRFSDKEPDEEIISPKQAEYNHAIQTLSGDAVDGYAGVPGIGPVTAHKLLGGLEGKDLWDKVLETYEKKKLSKEEALLNARMAYILQHENYKGGEIELWNFPI